MDYKKEIIEMINEIKKTGTLEYLYTFIKLFLEKWGDQAPPFLNQKAWNQLDLKQFSDHVRLIMRILKSD